VASLWLLLLALILFRYYVDTTSNGKAEQMTKTHYANRFTGKTTYLAMLHEFDDGTCEEIVQVNTAMGMKTIAQETFPAKNLGDASRDAYLRCVLASAAFKYDHNT